MTGSEPAASDPDFFSESARTCRETRGQLGGGCTATEAWHAASPSNRTRRPVARNAAAAAAAARRSQTARRHPSSPPPRPPPPTGRRRRPSWRRRTCESLGGAESADADLIVGRAKGRARRIHVIQLEGTRRPAFLAVRNRSIQESSALRSDRGLGLGGGREREGDCSLQRLQGTP